VLPFSYSSNQLHSCRLSIAETQGANNRQEQSKAPLTVWYEIHTNTQPNTATKSKKYKQEKGVFQPPILQKQRHPTALQTINCTPADC
jgi:hypothetical protein